ncbi:MAG TPA: sialidase family protein [Mycobacteriales bacterium]|nr:sialidase family protein [Mycobacteriales bacterium]
MRLHTRRPLLAVAVAVAAVTVPALASGRSHAAVHGRIFEQKLTNDPHYAEGEPSIAVNPRNQRNIIITFLANTGFGAYAAQNDTTPSADDVEENIQRCDYLVTFDGGRTWKRRPLPITNFDMDPTRPNCSDTLVQFDKRGVAYVVGSDYQFPTFTIGQGDFRMISSRDGGRTWSKPSVVAPAALSPSPDFSSWQGVRFYDDREFMAIDDSSGTIYVTGTQGRLDATGAAGDIQYLTASHDGGKTWSNGIAVGPAEFAPLGAAFGTVAVVSPPPTGATRACSCYDLVVSTNGAKGVVRRPTPIAVGSPGPLGGASTAADPSHRNHFAVLAVQPDGRMLVYRTPDAGRSWSKPSVVYVQGRSASKPWISYSGSGVLAVGWRGMRPDGSYGFYGAYSRDGGAHWTIRRISRGDSPTNDQVWVAGDDTSAIVLTGTMLYAAWGDWRGHELHTWWGGIPLTH